MILSAGEVVAVDKPTMPYGYSSTGFVDFGANFATYEAIYRAQPAVRTVIGFVARNIAQLGIHVFDRVSDVDRARLAQHPLVDVLENPMPLPESKMTRFRLIDATLNDLGIYDNAYWVKIRRGPRLALLRVPANKIRPVGSNWLLPEGYTISGRNGTLDLEPADVVHFYGFNPLDSRMGLSKMETLRQILAEEISAADYRARYWQNAARISGVVERPLDAPEWGDTERKRFRREFSALHTGADNSGGTAILEDGMTWKAASFSARDSQAVEGRKLSREEVAAVFHVPQHAVGILDHATFSNITEQHRELYQDCFGPTIESFQQDLERQLLPDLDRSPTVYVEFNLAAKLNGSFEQQAALLTSAVGGPYMSPNEARARVNLPSRDDGEQLNPSPTTPGAAAPAADPAPAEEPAA